MLLHDPKLPSSFQSWRRGYNPDNIFVLEKISNMCQKSVLKHIPKSQHRPIMIQVTAAMKPLEIPFRKRYNFNKANWCDFKILLDKEITGIKPEPENYLCFTNLVKTISKKMYT